MCVLFLPPSFFSQRSARALVVRDPSGDLRAAQAQAELKRVDQHKHIPLRWPPWVCSLGWGWVPRECAKWDQKQVPRKKEKTERGPKPVTRRVSLPLFLTVFFLQETGGDVGVARCCRPGLCWSVLPVCLCVCVCGVVRGLWTCSVKRWTADDGCDADYGRRDLALSSATDPGLGRESAQQDQHQHQRRYLMMPFQIQVPVPPPRGQLQQCGWRWVCVWVVCLERDLDPHGSLLLVGWTVAPRPCWRTTGLGEPTTVARRLPEDGPVGVANAEPFPYRTKPAGGSRDR